MKKTVLIWLILFIFIGFLGFYLWPLSTTIKHYTEAELVGSTCAELSEKHEEVILAYHDASIARYRKKGSFEDDLGLPDQDILPIIIVMKLVIRQNAFSGIDLTLPFLHSPLERTPKLHSEFFSEVTKVCATYPAMDAVAAVLRAAENMNLVKRSANQSG